VHSVRVLFGALPESLRDALVEVISQESDIELLGVCDGTSLLLSMAGELRADVVVLGAADGGLPGVATHLVDQYPDIRVVAVAPEGRAALVYGLQPRIDTFSGSSPAELAKPIRAACYETG